MSSLDPVVSPRVTSLGFGIFGVRARATSILVGAGLLATALALSQVFSDSAPARLGGWVYVDATSRLFLALINPIFVGVSLYVHNRVSTTPALRAGMGSFVACALVLLVASNVALVSNHLIASWIALEVTTFCAAPLIQHEGTTAARLASFRYLLFSSVGLGLVLLGLLCLGRGLESAGHSPSFFIQELDVVRTASANSWGKLGLSLVILGLGSKLGLAPMNSWLPEAYDEAPPSVTALLAAVQFNAVLVVLLRVVHIFRPVHPTLVSAELLVLGLASVAISTLNVVATRNMKRLVAYASINHAGVIAIGLGVGRTAAYGLFIYVISNALIKAILFLTTGKIRAHYGTNDTRQIVGLLKDLPYSGVFLMVGTFALLGFPPFGSFFGELLILSSLIEADHVFVFAALCAFITASFVAIGRTMFPMIWGEPRHERNWPRQTFASAVPKLFFLLVLVVLGVYIPKPLNDLIAEVAAGVEAR